jgi:hydrogenase/urease accessory protein HupE
MKISTKAVIYNALGAATLMTSLPALAHSEHASTMSGIVHFMTEPDHLAISGLIAAVAIFAIRRMGKKKV